MSIFTNQSNHRNKNWKSYASLASFCFFLLLNTFQANAQIRVVEDNTVVVGPIDGHVSSAKFEVHTEDGGILIPRLTAAQRDAIQPRVDGLLVYVAETNDDIRGFWYFDAGLNNGLGEWIRIASNADELNVDWSNITNIPGDIADGDDDTNYWIQRSDLDLEYAEDGAIIQPGGRVRIGDDAGKGVRSTFIGQSAGKNANPDLQQNIGIGVRALQNVNSANNNIGIGYETLQNPGGQNVAIGYSSGRNLTGTHNYVNGYAAGQNLEGSNNFVAGKWAGQDLDGGSNIAIGSASGRYLAGIYNIVTGHAAGQSIDGDHNFMSGYLAGQFLQGNHNISVGYAAGKNLNGSGNIGLGFGTLVSGNYTKSVAIGFQALTNSATPSEYVIALGHRAGYSAEGTHNIYMGNIAGYSVNGSDNIFLGRQAGQHAIFTDVSNRLIIDSRYGGTSHPLVYGEFDNRVVKINNDLEVNSLNTSDFIKTVDDRLLPGSWSDVNVSDLNIDISTGVEKYTDLDFTGTTGLSDGVDNVDDADNDPTNEIETWSTLNGIPTGFADNIDNVDDADNDPTNEIETWSTLDGIPSGFTDNIDNVDDEDNDPTNEIQDLSIDGNELSLSGSNETITFPLGESPWEVVEDSVRRSIGHVMLEGGGSYKLNDQYISADNKNFAVGFAPGEFGTWENYNIMIGDSAGINNSGDDNIFLGRGAGQNNPQAGKNVYIGKYAGQQSTSGSSNQNNFIGVEAGRFAAAGNNNYFGIEAGRGQNEEEKNFGSNNNFIGYKTGSNNTTGSVNIFIGSNAGRDNTEGDFNTFLGSSAGLNNTTGELNVCVGSSAGNSNTTGVENVYIGRSAGNYPTINNNGDNNVMIGRYAGGTSTGNDNTFVGNYSGFTNNSGNSNTCIGHNTNTEFGLERATAIGYAALVDSDDKVRIGNSTSIVEVQDLVEISDGRFKENVQPNVPGLKFIEALNPVTYNFNSKKYDTYKQQNFADSSKTFLEDKVYQTNFEVRHTGFIAQEVEQAAKMSKYDFDGVIPANPGSKTSTYAISYNAFVVPLVKAVQEQQDLIETLQVEKSEQATLLKTQATQLEQLLKRIEALENK